MENIALIVLDASVVIKWFVSEDDDALAEKIRQDFMDGHSDIVVPDLLRAEVANGLRYKPSFTKRGVHDAITTLEDLGINIVYPDLPLYEQAISIAFDYDITVYDALYVALALEYEYTLITADDKLVKRLPAEFGVRHLRTYEK